MGEIKINDSLEKPKQTLPRYTSNVLNKANGHARSTYPIYVGKIDKVFPEYMKHCARKKLVVNYKTWEEYHKKKFPEALIKGKAKLTEKINEMKMYINGIDDELIEQWYKFFIYNQTFYGKYREFMISQYFESRGINVTSRSAGDSNKIDLIVNGIPCQIKPFGTNNANLNEEKAKGVVYIYYKKEKGHVIFNWDSPKLDALLPKE
jgi:hypothetical protein